MDRRNFLKSTSAAALGFGTPTLAAATAAKAADDAHALAAPHIVGNRRTLRMVNLWPDRVSGPADHIHRLMKRMEAATDGRWVIDIDETPVTGADAYKAVMTAEADLYAGHEHAHRALHPAFSYFAGLPCGTGMDIAHFDAWLTAAGGQELWDELAGEFNMKGLAIGYSGAGNGLDTRMPVTTRADLRDKRIAVSGLAADILAAVDARPVESVTTHLLEVIGDTSLDGIELHGPALWRTRQQAEALDATFPHRLLPSLSDTGHAITLGLRRSFWDGLTTSERIMVSAIAREALATSRAEIIAAERALDQITDTAIRTPAHQHPPQWDALAGEFNRIATAIVADLSGKDEHCARINASYMAFKGHPHVPAHV